MMIFMSTETGLYSFDHSLETEQALQGASNE